MEIISFTVGVLSVTAIYGAIAIINNTQKLRKLEERLDLYEREIESVYRRINQATEYDNRRIDEEIDRVNSLIINLHTEINALSKNNKK